MPPPPPPPPPDAGGHSPLHSPEASSSVMGSGSEIDPSGSMRPRRRSLRLASLSISSPCSDSSSPAAESSRERNTRPRASKSVVEARGLGTRCSKAGAGKRKVEVLEVTADSSLAEDSKRRVLHDRVGGKYMCLRSGSKIASRGTDQLPIDNNNKFQNENLVSGGHCIEEAGNIEETASREERFPHQEEGKGISVVVDPTELPCLKTQAESNAKGKEKLVVEEDSLPVLGSEIDMNMDATPEGAVVHSQSKGGSVNRRKPQKEKVQVGSRKEADRSRAIELAPKFAFFKTKEDSSGEEEDEQEDPENLSPDDKKEDWPGPFSTAMKIIEERYEKLRARELNSSVKKSENIQSRISWVPSKNRKLLNRVPSTLRDLCLKVLSDNVEEIESLDGIPDILKNKLISRLCHTRKMSSHLLGLLVRGTPTQICLSDCSWVTEDLFEEVFSKCDMKYLKVIQLDMCGRCLPDYIVRATLAQYPISLPSLTAMSLKGAYRLSDDGVKAIASSAPSLSSVNLSQCSLLTSSGIITIADQLPMVLRELYIDDCQNVDAMAILPALKNLDHLEVLSVAGIHSVCDKFVQRLIPVCGSHMKELVFAGCQKLTTASIRTIGAYCPRLCAIDLENLRRLNDSALGYLANGCRSLQKLKLRRNGFSDEAVAAFLEALGGSLTELSLNNVAKVAEQTALAISHQCSSTLYSLDLSFCREMTDEALGLIVDSCSSLRILRLFGCTQVTEVFFNGHSNSSVKLIGCEGQLLDGIGTPCCDY